MFLSVCVAWGLGERRNGYHGYQVYFFCVGVFVMGTTGTKYVLYWVWGSDIWVPRIPSILLLCECFCVFVLGPTGIKYILYCDVGERFMGTTGTKYTSSVWVFL